MQYILSAALLLMLIISYYFTGRDVLSPMTVQTITFLFGALMCIIMLPRFNYKLHWQTTALIASNLFISVLVGITVHNIFQRVPVQMMKYADQGISPISGSAHFFVICFIAAVLAWKLIFIYRTSGIGPIGQLLADYRTATYIAYSRNNEQIIPFGIRQADHIFAALRMIYGFDLIRFYDRLSKKQKAVDILVISVSLLWILLSGERMGVVQYIIMCAMMFHLLRIKKAGKYRPYNLKMLFRLVLLCVLILVVFVKIATLVGRTPTELDALYQLFPYVGAQIANLDIYIQAGHAHSDFFGKYTFYDIYTFFRTIGLSDIPFYQHGDVFSSNIINWISLGNVYGMFKTYYTDFGTIGVYVLNFFSALAFSVSYEYTKKHLRDQGILLFSYMYIGVVLSFFYECFYTRVFTIGYLENVLLIIGFYHIFIRKKLRVGHKTITVRLKGY